MRNTAGIFVAIISVVLLIVRFARCNSNVSKLQWRAGAENYMQACQDMLDSTAIAFTPVATATREDRMLPNDSLQAITIRLYDLARAAGAIDAFNDEGGYFKKRIVAFIELERGLTCCYLQRYNDDMRSGQQPKPATITNLTNWIEQYDQWKPVYRDEYFNYHNTVDWSRLYNRLGQLAAKSSGTTHRSSSAH